MSIVGNLFADPFRDFPSVLRRFCPRSTQSFGRLQDKDVPPPPPPGAILKRELIRSLLPRDELLSNGH
ncbi:hypothetical protein [uncultured Salipiger sp.]|uniref:hypothetical protein n=1 Tax=uncultured Salipiger sp. TaxID=499810 RepID=UPI002592505D|nr:hypothetical protein [uncultured Salipiger sp.]